MKMKIYISSKAGIHHLWHRKCAGGGEQISAPFHPTLDLQIKIAGKK
jgi:hypothetical protein